jgi:hypothetical protein
MPRGSVYRHEVVNRPTPVAGIDTKNALVASARTYEAGSLQTQSLRKTGRRTRSSEWQNELWDMYDQVPEFRAGCSWVGNLLSKAELMVYKDGKPTTDADALDALASLFGGREGQEEMLRLLGINFTVAGEAFVVGLPQKDDDDEWEVIASTEVQGETTNSITIEGERVPDGTLAIRLWKAHPRKSNESDCPARALLPTLSEIVRLNQVIASLADSRLKGNGILFVPSELEMPAIPVLTADEDGNEQLTMQDSTSISEGITRRLIKIASIAMQNRDSAAAAVPLVIAAPGEYLEKVQWIDFWTGFDEHSQKLREEARKSIGIGLDMPPEVITGTADVNHWGAWQIEEAAIKVHTEPLLNVIVSSLTKGYLHPVLKAWGVKDYASYTFEVNTAALRLRPNRSKEAIELWDRGELSARTMLIENGFDPDNDSPEEKERVMFFLSTLARKTSATPDQLAEVLRQIGVQGVPGDAADQRGALERPSLETHPVRDIPDADESEADDAVAVRASGALVAEPSAFVIDGLLLASEVLVDRALERAGNRLKARIGRRDNVIPATELYLHGPRLDLAECEALLQDAWGGVQRREYGVDKQRLESALHAYTLSLLRLQKPYDRAALSRTLILELTATEAKAA